VPNNVAPVYSVAYVIFRYACSNVYGVNSNTYFGASSNYFLMLLWIFFSTWCWSCKFIIHEDETTKFSVYCLEALESTNHSNRGIVSNKLVSFSFSHPMVCPFLQLGMSTANGCWMIALSITNESHCRNGMVSKKVTLTVWPINSTLIIFFER
jgi:hypothetical protein